MEENKQGYDPSEFEDDDYMTPQPDAGKSIRGYRIVIIILSVILVALSALYFSIHRQQMIDNRLLQSDRDSIQNDLGRLMTDFDNLQVTNDSISAGLTIERDRADSLMTRLKKERSWNLAKIKQYEKEVGTLRTIMKGYIRQIDSLNTLNKRLFDDRRGDLERLAGRKAHFAEFVVIAARTYAAPVRGTGQTAGREVDDELAGAADNPVGVAFGPHRDVAHRRIGADRPRPRHGQQVILVRRRAAAHQHRRQRIDERSGFPALFHRPNYLSRKKKLRKNTIW